MSLVKRFSYARVIFQVGLVIIELVTWIAGSNFLMKQALGIMRFLR